MPREAAHSGDPKPGTLAAPPATAEPLLLVPEVMGVAKLPKAPG